MFNSFITFSVTQFVWQHLIRSYITAKMLTKNNTLSSVCTQMHTILYRNVKGESNKE